jgi:hypothetical protein
MDWRMFFSRIKFSRYIILFLAALVGIGILIIFAGDNDFITAVLIYYVAIIISYVKTMGLFIIWMDKKHIIKDYIVLDSIITLVIAAAFGLRFIGLLKYSVLAYIVYGLLWAGYVKLIYIAFVKNANYYVNYKTHRQDVKSDDAHE